MAKTKHEQMTTPAAILLPFAAIAKPEVFQMEGAEDSTPRFKARIVLPTESPECQKLIAQIQGVWEQGYAEACTEKGVKKLPIHPEGKPYLPQVDRDTGEETGYTIFRFSQKSEIKSKKTGQVYQQRVKVFDSEGKLIANPPEAGGGSKVRLSGPIVPFVFAGKFGVSLRLEAVQIIDLKVWEGDNNDRFQFSREEGGYTGPEEETFPGAEGGDF